MALTLPYPSMNFVPLDVLTAAEQNQLVANIEYIANQFPITSANIDFTTIIEKVGTADNYALKYADGTMICCQRISCTTDTVETWGSLYNVLLKPSNVPYAVEFYSLPTISVTYESSGVNGMLATRYQTGYPTKAHAGTYTVARPTTASTNQPAILHIIAIGRWKA